jgi:hypothetical protein
VEDTCDGGGHDSEEEEQEQEEEQHEEEVHYECDRTTSEIRGLSPKIISGDSR